MLLNFWRSTKDRLPGILRGRSIVQHVIISSTLCHEMADRGGDRSGSLMAVESYTTPSVEICILRPPNVVGQVSS